VSSPLICPQCPRLARHRRNRDTVPCPIRHTRSASAAITRRPNARIQGHHSRSTRCPLDRPSACTRTNRPAPPCGADCLGLVDKLSPAIVSALGDHASSANVRRQSGGRSRKALTTAPAYCGGWRAAGWSRCW
jgi:hypothetical protein